MPSPKLKHSNLVNLPLVSYSSELGECVTQIYVEPYRIMELKPGEPFNDEPTTRIRMTYESFYRIYGTVDEVYNMIYEGNGDDQSS